jgi:radical SAM protein with 4Fe4S-binding SPASM domain
MPSLWSEPLLAKNFKDFARQVKDRGMALSLNTNGLIVREPLAAFFVEIGIDAVCFSIDATTPETLRKIRGIDKLDKIAEAVLMSLRARGDAPHPRIGVSFTVQPNNAQEEQAFIDHWVKIVDFVRVGQVYENGQFAGVETDTPRKACGALYNTMAIHANGNVSYCCLDGFAETSVGNVFEEGVRGVWHGAKMSEVRHWHETGQWDRVPFCANCDRWASYDFEETVKDGILIRQSPEYTYYNRIDRLANWTENMTGGLHKLPNQAPDAKAE